MSQFREEQQALKLAIYGNVFFSLMGLGFAFYTKSQAVLLDGVFSIIALILAVLTLYISRLLRRPGNEDYPFGYAAFEPIINLVKGMIIGLVMLVSFMRAVDTLLNGGNVIRAGGALIYGITATLACLGIAFYMRRKASAGGWPLVEVEVKNWFMDAAISAAVALSFFSVLLLQGSAAEPWLRYIDPLLVIIMSTVFLSIPYRIIRENWAQLTGSSPTDEITETVRAAVEKLLPDRNAEDHMLRVIQIGRLVYVNLYIICDKATPAGTETQDQLREKIYRQLVEHQPNITLDVVFTQNRIWAERAVNTTAMPTQ